MIVEDIEKCNYPCKIWYENTYLKEIKIAKLVSSFFIFTLLVVGFATGASANDADKDCKDFEGKPAELVEFWNANGYSESNDPHDLDRDNDGLPCETTQADFDNAAASQNEEDANEETSNDETIAAEEDNGSSDSTTEAKQESDSAVKNDSDEKVVQQGEALPKTATNSGMLMMISGGLLAAGLITLAVKKTQKA